jgi:hypothetical protein
VASRALPRGGPHLHQPYGLVASSVEDATDCGGCYTTHCVYSPWLHVGRAACPESTSAFVQTGIACSDGAVNDQRHTCSLQLRSLCHSQGLSLKTPCCMLDAARQSVSSCARL